MKEEFDLSKMKKRRNPYASRLKKQVTIRMGTDIISYFKEMAEESGVPYQNLINLYLQECVEKQKKPNLEWVT
jgi:predicted DNA binding CopG/RHH family protein